LSSTCTCSSSDCSPSDKSCFESTVNGMRCETEGYYSSSSDELSSIDVLLVDKRSRSRRCLGAVTANSIDK
jgi:hypothetical protein